MRNIGAVDIGGTKIAVAIVSESGSLLALRSCPTLPERGFADAMQRVDDLLRDARSEAGGFDGIGVGCPGPLDPFSGVLGEVGTLPGWKGASLAAELKSRFGVPVAVENDADAAALAEYHWGGASAASRFIYLAVSTGIGGGMMLDGKLYRGANGSHPEFGHQVLDANGPVCYCGANGCWESLASGTAMTAWMKARSPNSTILSAAEICERAADGDPLAKSAVERQAYYLGLGLANLVTLFVPEKIALGGGVMTSHGLFLEAAKKVVRTLCTQVPAERTEIACAALGQHVGVLGAARCWLHRFDQGDA